MPLPLLLLAAAAPLSQARAITLAQDAMKTIDPTTPIVCLAFVAEKTGWSYSLAPQLATQLYIAESLAGAEPADAALKKAVADARALSADASDEQRGAAIAALQKALADLYGW